MRCCENEDYHQKKIKRGQMKKYGIEEQNQPADRWIFFELFCSFFLFFFLSFFFLLSYLFLLYNYLHHQFENSIDQQAKKLKNSTKCRSVRKRIFFFTFFNNIYSRLSFQKSKLKKILTNIYTYKVPNVSFTGKMEMHCQRLMKWHLDMPHSINSPS